MKKIIIVALAITVAFVALVGCDNRDSEMAQTNQTIESASDIEMREALFHDTIMRYADGIFEFDMYIAECTRSNDEKEYSVAKNYFTHIAGLRDSLDRGCNETTRPIAEKLIDASDCFVKYMDSGSELDYDQGIRLLKDAKIYYTALR